MVSYRHLRPDERAFYNKLVERTKRKNRNERYTKYNLDPDEGDIEVFWTDIWIGNDSEICARALHRHIVSEFSKIKGLDHNSDESINLTHTTTRAFRQLVSDCYDLLPDTLYWSDDEPFFYMSMDIPEYHEMLVASQENATKEFWREHLSYTPFEDLPEKYFLSPDMDGDGSCEWHESEEYFYASANFSFPHIAIPQVLKAIADKELDIELEELEDFFWKRQDWGDVLMQHDILTDQEYPRRDLVQDGAFWYYIPALLKRQEVQTYHNPFINLVRNWVAGSSRLYALAFNSNYCVTERYSPTNTAYEKDHAEMIISVWCPHFRCDIRYAIGDSLWSPRMRQGEYMYMGMTWYGDNDSDVTPADIAQGFPPVNSIIRPHTLKEKPLV